MRLRQWIGMIAVFGVLLHAVAVVRHHGLMLGVHLQYQALVSDLSAICHGGRSIVAETSADLPYVPKPSDAQNGCPICSGQAPAYTVVSIDLVEVPATTLCADKLERAALFQTIPPYSTGRPPGAPPPWQRLPAYRVARRRTPSFLSGGVPMSASVAQPLRLSAFGLHLQVLVAIVLSLLALAAICQGARAQSSTQPLPPLVVQSPPGKTAPKAAAPKASPTPAMKATPAATPAVDGGSPFLAAA